MQKTFGSDTRLRYPPADSFSDLSSSEGAGKEATLRPITALEARVFADAQAKVWDPLASLIYVESAVFIIPSSGSIEIGGWAFVYQSPVGNACLGVLAGSTGILDVGKKHVNPSELSGWMPIEGWTVDSDHSSLRFTTDGSPKLSLYSVTLNNGLLPVWRATTTVVLAQRLVDAKDGRLLNGEMGVPSIATQIEGRAALE